MFSLCDVKPIILLEVCILTVCYVGDYLLFSCQDPVIKAVSDNVTHGLVGALSWTIISFSTSISVVSNLKNNAVWILTAGLLSSGVDIDHFLAAQSFKLQVIQTFKENSLIKMFP